jgi:RNA polymerase sigma-70 factor (ECF subfamily)
MKVFAEISKFDPEKPFKIWLRKIVINSSIDQFRRRKRNSFYDESSSVLVPDQNPTVISSLTAGEVLRLLNQLPDIQKMVFSLYEMEGFSHEEIGSMLNIPVSSSRVYLTRAKKKLRKLFPLYFDIYDAGLGKR